jgi:hypothetical protein
LEHPNLLLADREQNRAKALGRPITELPENIPAKTCELKAKTIQEATAQAEKILQGALAYDKNLLATDSQWKKEARRMPATPRQKKAIAASGVLTQQETAKLSKWSASEILSLLKIKTKTLLALGKCPTGRYEGVDAALVAIKAPNYLKARLADGSAAKWGAAPLFEDALTQNPLSWLETNRRGIYKRFAEPSRHQIDQLWQEGKLQEARERVSQFTDQDPKRTWEIVSELAERRKTLFLERTRNCPKVS